MRVLLDTHTWLWFVLGDASLSSSARTLIEDKGNDVLISPASYWELAIKISLGKYVLPRPYEAFIRRAVADQGFAILPILPSHAAMVCSLPFHHRDPFDRLIAAQALDEKISLVSTDHVFDAYGVSRLW